MTPSTAAVVARNASSLPRGLHKVLALYKFIAIPREEIRPLQSEVDTLLRIHRARGTILLATEGINGTICYPIYRKKEDHEQQHQQEGEGEEEEADPILQYLHSHSYFAGVRTRVSFADTPIFHRLKVKVKREIVTMLGSGSKDEEDDDENEEQYPLLGPAYPKKVDPSHTVGTYIPPGKEWDDLLLDPDVLVIDTRNTYEVEMGTFHNAVSPGTDNFRQFPLWLQKVGDLCSGKEEIPITNAESIDSNAMNPTAMNATTTNHLQYNCRSTQPVPVTSIPPRFKGNPPKAVAMFCTGGIRCEKSTSFCIQEEIFPSHIPIYHLEGGILAYLEKHPNPETSLWNGDCFVFDHRVAVTHGLQLPTQKYDVCFACRHPLSEEDTKNEKGYIPGVCCKYCRDVNTEEDRERFLNRHQQIELAKKRGTRHMYDPKELNTDDGEKER